jgi:hypothetical protein
VVDFGIAKASAGEAQKVTRTGLVVGTPEYMSPEQLGGDTLDGRSDVYSLGLVAFNSLTGTLPFPGNSAQASMIMRLTSVPKSLAEMRPDVVWPAELQVVMDKVLAREAADRYQLAADFGRDFGKAVANMQGAAAADAGTLVMSPDAGTVPRTRVSAKSGATASLDAAALSTSQQSTRTKRSPAAMIVAAVVVIAGIGGAVVFMNRSGAAPAPAAAAPVATQSGSAAPAATSATGDKKVGTAANPGPRKGTGSDGDSGVRLLSKPSGANAANTQGPAPTQVTATVAATIARWDDAINNGSPTAADAARAIDELSPIIPKLSGRDRSNAIYLRMMAYGITENDVELCAAVKEVIASDPVANHVKTAEEAAKARQCK